MPPERAQQFAAPVAGCDNDGDVVGHASPYPADLAGITADVVKRRACEVVAPAFGNHRRRVNCAAERVAGDGRVRGNGAA